MNILKGVSDLLFSSKGKENMLSKKTELMVITMEECGELIQRCSKYIRYGDINGIKEEAGDIYAMLELMVEYNILNWEDIKNQAKIKRKKLSKFSNLL